MAKVNYTSQEIICSTVALMEWTLATLGLFAWEVALQDELGDLKDHVSLITMDDITYDEFFILEELDNKLICLTLQAAKAVEEYKDTIILLHPLDTDILSGGGAAEDLANALFNTYMFPQEIDVENLYIDICMLHLSIINLLYALLITVAEGAFTNEPEESEKDFLRDYLSYGLPEMLSEFDTSDKNISLIIDLMNDIDEVYIQLGNGV